jgi:heme-degrading monooxygenase HmoA
MIERHWRGIALREKAEDYVLHLNDETFKQLKGIRGFKGASVLSREVKEGTEFLIVTRWESLDAVRKFAGDDYETAVVPGVVNDMMVTYESRATHYVVQSYFD